MAKQIKPVKKATSKAPVPAKKKSAQVKYLAKVVEEYAFYNHDGQIFRDLNDLVNGLNSMTDETFIYHCNEAKNDFSCWIADIIGDKELAEKLKTIKTKNQAKEQVEQRYAELTKLEG